jgi:hypothetical protein
MAKFVKENLYEAKEESSFTKEQKDCIDQFLKQYKGDFEDDNLHALAKGLKLDVHEVEEYIYNLARTHLQERLNEIKKSKGLNVKNSKEETISTKLISLRNLFVKDGYKVDNEKDKLHVTNKKGHSITFKINDDEIDIIVPGYSDDIFVGTEKYDYKYFKEVVDSINKKWLKDNDPEGEQW